MPSDPPASRHTTVGLMYALLAYGWWGLAPIYFRVLRDVNPIEVVGHRVLWALPFLAILLAARGGWRDVIAALRDRRTVLVLATTAGLVTINWTCFVLAVGTGRTVEASLGYYINPLVSVVLGMVVLGERLRPLQWGALAVAAFAVVYLTIAQGRLPWISLALAFSFGFYGLLRKRAPVEALPGLAVEMLVLLIPATVLLAVLQFRGTGAMSTAPDLTRVLLLGAGIVTVLPLIWFTAGARRLRLVTIGFLQYLSPTGQFLCAILLFDEPFDRTRLIAFAGIWTAVLLYCTDSVRATRASRRNA